MQATIYSFAISMHIFRNIRSETAEECADMIHEFMPVARAVIGLNDLKDHQLWTETVKLP